MIKDDKFYDFEGNPEKPNTKGYGRKTNEPTGEAESLIGKKLHKFGDLAQREKIPISLLNRRKNEEYSFGTVKKSSYNPKTKDTQLIYEDIMVLVQKYLTDQPPEYITSAINEIIPIIKKNDISKEEKTKNISEIFGKEISKEDLSKLVILSKGLLDYDNNENKFNFNNNTNNNRNLEEEINMNIDIDEEQNKENDENNKKTTTLFEVEEVEKSDDDENLNNNDNNNDNNENINLIINDISYIKKLINEKLDIKDENQINEKETELKNILKIDNQNECENSLFLFFGNENIELIKLFLSYKTLILFLYEFNSTKTETSKSKLIENLKQNSKDIYNILSKKNFFTKNTKSSSKKINSNNIILSNIDLSKFDYIEADHYQKTKSLKIQTDIIEKTYQGYKEITIPQIKKNPNSKKIKQILISSLPEWMQDVFTYTDKNGSKKFITEKFNEIQSKVLPTALNTEENLLICAPTSSGKTNIALLCILRLLSLYRDENSGNFDLKNFKIVYIAPLKALVRETVGNFENKLEQFGVVVKELSGDVNLSTYEINNTNIIVTTPEKYDIITRKSGQNTFIEKVKLIIVDEIHLLHDVRGAILENIISRLMLGKISKNKYDSINNSNIRLVGLSATLPNYIDVAKFLQVDIKKGLFYFDSSYRPIPLKQIFLGISEKKGIKKMLLLNELTYKKTLEKITENKQVIIFVHSRRETLKTAKFLIETAKSKLELDKFKNNIPKQLETIIDEDIKKGKIIDKENLTSIFQYGIGIHHAGMNIKDKKIVEEYFSNQFLKVIISTATLAWGINLPANCIIIKGTKVYKPENGGWGELSFLDIMQMMGRAGRVGYVNSENNYGEGIIITTEEELIFYLSIMNQNLTIESQLIKNLADSLNAEIVSGNITNVKEGALWLKYTFLYQRMLISPELYGLSKDDVENDKDLFKRRCDLIHSAAILLEKNGLIKYDLTKGNFISNNIGKIASHYYIKYNSMGTYNKNIHENMTELDLLNLFSLSEEFKLIPLRAEEKKEIKQLYNKVPYPIKSNQEEERTKINILLQCYIANIKLDGYAINSDMIFISQNANRLFRALFELCLSKSWAKLTLLCLKFCKEIQHRMWDVMTPLRQFKIIPEKIIHRIEAKEQLTFDRLCECNVTQMIELLHMQKNNCDSIYKLIHTFPKVNVEINLQPLTRNCIYFDVYVSANFTWLTKYHPYKELFHLFLLDNDCEIILHHEMFWLKEKNINDEKNFGFIVPVTEVLPPYYFMYIISDSWIKSIKMVPVCLQNLILPDKFSPPTEYNNNYNKISYKEIFMKLFEINEDFSINNNSLLKKIIDFYKKKYNELNNIQSQCISSVYNNNSIFIGASTGSGKTQLAEFTMLKKLLKFDENKNDIVISKLKAPIIYLCANQDLMEEKYEYFTNYLKNVSLVNIKINFFIGDFEKDNTNFESSDIILTTFKNFDQFLGKFKSIINLKEINLIIIDDLHLLNNEDCVLESALTRFRIVLSSYQNKLKTKLECRYVILSTPLSNYSDVCEWLGVPEENRFNFEMKIRPNIIEYFMRTFDNISHKARINLMTKDIYNLFNKYSFILQEKSLLKLQSIIYLCDSKSIKNFLMNFLQYFINNELEGKCIMKKIKNYNKILQSKITEENTGELYYLLIKSLESGIGIICEDNSPEINEIVSSLYEDKIIQVLIISYKCLWFKNLTCQNIFICDTTYYDENNECYMNYYIPDILQMVGRAQQKNKDPKNKNQLINNKCFILMPTSKKEFIKKFLNESYPLETSIHNYLETHFLTDINNKIINSKQKCVDWLTWTFFYKRLLKNPQYYELKGKSQQFLFEYISELVENKLNELANDGKIIVTDEKIQIANKQ